MRREKTSKERQESEETLALDGALSARGGRGRFPPDPCSPSFGSAENVESGRRTWRFEV